MKKVSVLVLAAFALAACGDSKPPPQDPTQAAPSESAAPAGSSTAAPAEGSSSGGW